MGRKHPVDTPRSLAWRIAFLVLCTVGFCLSADLQRLHVNVHTDPDYVSYCAMSERVNCETVAASGYAVFVGLPLAVWGLLGYAGMATLAIWGLRRRLPAPGWPYGLLFAASLLAAAVGALLFFLSHFVIESVCLVCAGTYAVNFALFAVAWMELRRAGTGPWQALRNDLTTRKRVGGSLAAITAAAVVLLVVLFAAIPKYWEVATRTGPDGLSVGRSPEGHYWIGARNPKVTIVEYSDYECPHCQRGHAQMRDVVRRHPEVRLVHRSYPLDNACNPHIRKPFHRNACRYARMAHCAGELDRFWEANDYLFQRGRERDAVGLATLAAAIEVDGAELEACFADSESVSVVQQDIAAGRALDVRGTPTFVLDGRTYPGGIPADVLEAALRKAGGEAAATEASGGS